MAQTPPDGAPPAFAAAPRRVSLPPQPYDRVKIFGGLLLVVLLCTPVWLVALGTAGLTEDREAQVLLTARETWQRHATDPRKRTWLIPTYHGQGRYNPPPVSAWLTLAAWGDLHPGIAGPELLILRARLMAVGLGLLTLLATYWAGMSVGDARVARIAAAALATTLLFVHQVRTASTETFMLAWTTLAVAAGLWAMRPLKDINWVGRRITGWFIAGVALAAAVLTEGIKPAALFVLPPLLAAIVLTPRRKLDNLLGLSFACILGVVAACPWYLYVLQRHPEAEASLFGAALPPQELFILSRSHWRLFVVLSPWAVWLIGAMFQPFIRADHERRRQLLIAWFWFLMLFVILSIPASRSPRYLTPLLPAAALLVGQLWAFHAQLASERQLDPGVDLLRIPHWLSLGVVSVAGPLLLIVQPWLITRGWLGEPLLVGLSPWMALALGVAALLLAIMGARWHFKWKPRLAAYATAAWMIAVLAVCLPAYEQTADRAYRHRGDAAMVGEQVAGRGMLVLAGPHDKPVDNAFLFYVGSPVRFVTPEQLPSALRQTPDAAVIAPALPAYDRLLAGLGFTSATPFRDGQAPRRLYRR